MNLQLKEDIQLNEPAKSYMERYRKQNSEYQWLTRHGLKVKLCIDGGLCTIFLTPTKSYSVEATKRLERLKFSFKSGSYTAEKMRERLDYCLSTSHLGKALSEISDQAYKVINNKT